MKRTHSSTIALALMAALMGCGGCSQSSYRQAAGNTWGTVYHITYCSPVNLDDSITAVMRMIDLSLSPFEPASIVSRLNRGDTTALADDMLREVIDLSQQVNKASQGAFDPTLAPLINLWGFGYKQGSEAEPTQAQIDSALTLVGIADCRVGYDGRVTKKDARTEFNFSAIAKGYGVDKIAQMLRRNGCTDYMVEVGGEIALSGKNPRGSDWRIQIDAPTEEEAGDITHDRLTVLSLTDCCIATSGNYRNYREIAADGTHVGHTISSVTGRPVATSTLSATIVAPTCALADALATSVMAMPWPQAQAMLRDMGVDYLVVIADGDGYHIEKNTAD